MGNLELLAKALEEHRTVDVTYRKLAKKSIVRETKDYRGLEVYEFRDGKVFVYDPTAGHIKQFRLCDGDDSDGVVFVRLNDQKFEPRYKAKV